MFLLDTNVISELRKPQADKNVQAWARSEDWILTGANWMYVNSHFLVTTTFLACHASPSVCG